MRLIDADALIPLIQEEKIEGKTLDIIKALGEGLQAETLNQACDRHIKIISSLPTIDAVPVVRCGECKALILKAEKPRYSYMCCKFNGLTDPKPNNYCSYGERKTAESE